MCVTFTEIFIFLLPRITVYYICLRINLKKYILLEIR